MWKPVLGAIAGLLVGATFGIALALLMPSLDPSPPGFTSYPTLSNPNPLSGTTLPYQLPVYFVFLGTLLGGGFGALVGSIAGATRAVCGAMTCPSE